MEFLGGILSGGASLLGGMLNNSNRESMQSQQNEWNAMLQIQNQQWMTQMSNTAYQRGVADMKAAGLNPMMMFSGAGGPASSPTGSAATTGLSGMPSDPIGPAVGAAIQAIDALTTVEQKGEQNKLIAAQTAKQVSEIEKTKVETANAAKEGGWIDPIRESQRDLNSSSARNARAQAIRVPSQNRLDNSRAQDQEQRNEDYKTFGTGDIRNPITWGHVANQTARSLSTIGQAVNDRFLKPLEQERSSRGSIPGNGFENNRVGRGIITDLSP